MKNSFDSQSASVFSPSTTNAEGRFQVLRQTGPGICIATLCTDTEDEAVEAFVLQAPAFEGEEIRLIDRNEQCTVARTKWKMYTIEIGLCVLHRENVFHDWHLALIACQVQTREQIRVTVELSAESA